MRKISKMSGNKTIRKWYFCLSESSIDRAHHGWRDLIIAAINSARKNTELEPILLFDGGENPFLDCLREKGVKIIKHRVSFYDALEEREKTQPGYLAIASGAFLRTEIPLIENEDDFVLYTDCDVTFQRNPDCLDMRPEYFACAPQQSMTDYIDDANTGVLIINVKKMRETFPAFSEFIRANIFSGWPGCDQENYRRFYYGKWEKLPLTMNWKPYWGNSDAAEIVHWHGPKPEAISEKIKNPEKELYHAWEVLYGRNKSAYEKFLLDWNLYIDPLGADKIIGHIDVFNRKKIIGWALYSSEKKIPVIFKAYLNGEFVREITCSNDRSDLERVYKTNIGGFVIDVPESIYDGDAIKLELFDSNNRKISLKYNGVLLNLFEKSGCN